MRRMRSGCCASAALRTTKRAADAVTRNLRRELINTAAIFRQPSILRNSTYLERSYLFGYHAFTLEPLRELVRAFGELVKDDELASIEITSAFSGTRRP